MGLPVRLCGRDHVCPPRGLVYLVSGLSVHDPTLPAAREVIGIYRDQIFGIVKNMPKDEQTEYLAKFDAAIAELDAAARVIKAARNFTAIYPAIPSYELSPAVEGIQDALREFDSVVGGDRG